LKIILKSKNQAGARNVARPGPLRISAVSLTRRLFTTKPCKRRPAKAKGRLLHERLMNAAAMLRSAKRG